MSAAVYRWERLPVDRPLPLIERRRVMGEKMMISRVVLSPGCDVKSHAHDNEQFALVLSGRVRFGLGAPGTPDYREETLGAGDVLHLPSNLPHSAYAIEETHILDLFSPPSQQTGVDRQRG